MLSRWIRSAYLGIREPVLRSWIRPEPAARIPELVTSILVVADRRLGDVCLALPTLQILRETYPQANLGIAVSRNLQPLVEWACQPTSLLDYSDETGITRPHWDVVIDLGTDYYLKFARLAARTRSPIRIGFDSYGRGRVLQCAIEELFRTAHAANVCPGPGCIWGCIHPSSTPDRHTLKPCSLVEPS